MLRKQLLIIKIVNWNFGAFFILKTVTVTLNQYIQLKNRNKMTATENLISEHKYIIELLGIMSKISEKIISNEVFYTRDIEDIIHLLKHFIENSHHKKEEIFYPALTAAELPNDREELSIMFYEHALARNYIKDISSCVINCKIGNSFSQELLAESMMKYVVLLKNHIRKEEKIIFPMANKILDEDEQVEIYKQFEKIEEKIVQHVFHEHYHRLLENLKNKYPDKEYQNA